MIKHNIHIKKPNARCFKESNLYLYPKKKRNIYIIFILSLSFSMFYLDLSTSQVGHKLYAYEAPGGKADTQDAVWASTDNDITICGPYTLRIKINKILITQDDTLEINIQTDFNFKRKPFVPVILQVNLPDHFSKAGTFLGQNKNYMEIKTNEVGEQKIYWKLNKTNIKKLKKGKHECTVMATIKNNENKKCEVGLVFDAKW